MISIPSLFFFCSFCFACLSGHVSSSADAISWGSSLSANQSIVSAGGVFELGFFEPGSSRNAYIGIWYKGRPERPVVWVANRETPINNTYASELAISESGNLVLLNQFKTQVWSSSINSTPSKNTTAILLDTGNFVLRDGSNSSVVYWQSFDHPTDTWLPGAKFGWSVLAREYMALTSWKNHEDPAPGLYTFTVDKTVGIKQIVQLWNMTQVYYATGIWTAHGQIFNNMSIVFTSDEREQYMAYTIADSIGMTRFVMDASGQTKQLGWQNNGSELVAWGHPGLQCDVPFFCGALSICDDQASTTCVCLPGGFEPASWKDWKANYWNGGCRRITPLPCGSNGSADIFMPLSNTMLVGKLESVEAHSANDCEYSCLQDCFCTAYSYNGSGCFVSNGELFTLKRPSEGVNMSQVVHIRLAASGLPPSRKRAKGTFQAIVIGVVLVSLVLAGILFFLVWRSTKKEETNRVFNAADDSGLLLFCYRNLKHFTKKFSQKLGRGSFGSVFKGVLPDCRVVAVKKLEGLRQGEKQFRSEISTLGTIQHVNLVRLLGYCTEGARRLLVYEYMPNGSLDSLLFSNESKDLDWPTRYNIALGVAKGLAYLHEECRDCIIHCDVKPENILLNVDFCPKVADFGMAKLFGRDFSRVLTTVKGTIGYLAPEWLSGQKITVKIDVYSFGMMLFEIISGKRNTSNSEVEGMAVFFPIWAAGQVSKGECLSLLDERLQGDANAEELGRLCRVACWCIQDEASCRPSMGQIVRILEGVVQVDAPPVPRFLRYICASQN